MGGVCSSCRADKPVHVPSIRKSSAVSRHNTLDEDFLASDCVFIEIEHIKVDELASDLPAELEYPPPRPPSKSLLVHTGFFETASGQNDSDEASVSDKGSLFNESDEYRPDFKFIDHHASKARSTVMDSFGELGDYLKEGISSAIHQDLYLVRALLVWLSSQNIKNIYCATDSEVTPRWLLYQLREKRATYASVFTYLCRKCNVKCKRISGTSRFGGFEPGDKESHQGFLSVWTAVYISRSWYFVEPFAFCNGVKRRFDGWVKVNKTGKIGATDMKKQRIDIEAFSDFFFILKPQFFKYLYFPHGTEWQLLPEKDLVRSMSAFMNLPYFLPPYFDLDLELHTEQSCVLQSTDGLREVCFVSKRVDWRKINMQYELFAKNQETTYAAAPMSRLVFYTKVDNAFIFEFRAPRADKYKLVFYGGPYGTAPLRTCEFLVDCLREMENFCPLPIDTDIYGWGPGLHSEKFGLFLPSKANGKIVLRGHDARQQTISTAITFKLDPEANHKDFKVELTSGSDFEGEVELDSFKNTCFCGMNTTKTELYIEAEVSLKIEHALTIKAGKQPVCHYLLSPAVTKRDTVPQKKSREALIAAMHTEDHVALEAAIEKCRKEKMEEQDADLVAAKKRLPYLKHKNALKDCIHRRNLDVTNKALKDVYKYPYQHTLRKHIEVIEKLKEKLEQLHGFPLDVPHLQEAADELHTTPHPPREAFNTIKALLLLCDGPKHTLEEWKDAQVVLNRAGGKGTTIFDKMKAAKQRHLEEKEIDRIRKVLESYKPAEVNKSSQAAFAFYEWTDTLLKHNTDALDLLRTSDEYATAEQTRIPR